MGGIAIDSLLPRDTNALWVRRCKIELVHA